MFLLGHLGIGLKTASPFRRDLPLKPLLLGTLLPDLIDKPLYYGLAWATGRRGFDLGLISGTRTFGHTLLFTISLAALASARRSKMIAALALGSATHLLLDVVSDVFTRKTDYSLHILAWPLLGWRFPGYLYEGIGEHLGHFRQPFFLYAELIGAFILIAEWRGARRR
ncbi:MAG: hypothetical protein ACHQ2Z_11210 [Elusimicrobiota bacterium]